MQLSYTRHGSYFFRKSCNGKCNLDRSPSGSIYNSKLCQLGMCHSPSTSLTRYISSYQIASRNVLDQVWREKHRKESQTIITPTSPDATPDLNVDHDASFQVSSRNLFYVYPGSKARPLQCATDAHPACTSMELTSCRLHRPWFANNHRQLCASLDVRLDRH